jgi:hypothetical protein
VCDALVTIEMHASINSSYVLVVGEYNITWKVEMVVAFVSTDLLLRRPEWVSVGYVHTVGMGATNSRPGRV